MNLSESMKYVLKTRGQNIFVDFWKEDVTAVIKEVAGDFFELAKSGKHRAKEFSFQEVRASSRETLTIIRLVPKRLKEAFGYFKEDYLRELEQLPDSRTKTVFSVKVLAALSKFIVTAIYGMKKTKAGFSFQGLRHRNAFTQFLVAELVIRISQVFILRFLSEVEKEVDEPGAIRNLRYFRSIISDSARGAEEIEDNPVPGDRAYEIVESLKNYISTGER